MSLVRLTPTYLTHALNVDNLLIKSVRSRWWPSFFRMYNTRLKVFRKAAIQPKRLFRSFKFELKRNLKWKKRRWGGSPRKALVCVLRHKRNNLFVTCYTQYNEGALLFTDSIGRHSLRGPRKRTLFAAQTVGRTAKAKLNQLDSMLVRGRNTKQIYKKHPTHYNLTIEGQVSSKAKGAAKEIRPTKYKLNYLVFKPISAHNGIRGKKQVRTKRKRRRR